ncbi:hypothetical protein C5C82_10640, partial [Rathayibacter sp. AY1D5]
MEGVCTMNQRPPDAWNRSAAATRTASRAVVVPIRAVRRRDRRGRSVRVGEPVDVAGGRQPVEERGHGARREGELETQP